MNWQYILKADWTFINNPNSSTLGSYNKNTDTININLVAFTQLLEELFEMLEEEGDSRIRMLIGDMTLNQALNAPVGEVLEKFLIERIIDVMEHESIHEAHHLTNLREEVIKVFSNKEFDDVTDALYAGLSTEQRRIRTGADVWELFISKYYDELFVRVQQGNTYEKALEDTIDYITNWMDSWKDSAIEAAMTNPQLGPAAIPIFVSITNRIWRQFENVYTELTQWLANRARTLTDNLENMVAEIKDNIVENINNMSEKEFDDLKGNWKSNLRAQSHLSESGKESYEENKDVWEGYR